MKPKRFPVATPCAIGRWRNSLAHEGSARQAWSQQLRAEIDNLRAALTWSLEAGKQSIALGLGSLLADSLGLVWGSREGRYWMERLLPRDPNPYLPANVPRYSPSPPSAPCTMATWRRHKNMSPSFARSPRPWVPSATWRSPWSSESLVAGSRGDHEKFETLSTEAIRMLRQLDDPFLLRALHNRTTRLRPAGRFRRGKPPLVS